MNRHQSATRRSDCPLNVSLEAFGDRWTLLVVRDLMLKGRTTFREFLEGGEGIASNVLADRLERLEAYGIVERRRSREDARRIIYRLTEKGVDLAPVLIEMIVWAARYEETAAPPAEIKAMVKNRKRYLTEIRKRWSASETTGAIAAGGRKPAMKSFRIE